MKPLDITVSKYRVVRETVEVGGEHGVRHMLVVVHDVEGPANVQHAGSMIDGRRHARRRIRLEPALECGGDFPAA